MLKIPPCFMWKSIVISGKHIKVFNYKVFTLKRLSEVISPFPGQRRRTPCAAFNRQRVTTIDWNETPCLLQRTCCQPSVHNLESDVTSENPSASCPRPCALAYTFTHTIL